MASLENFSGTMVLVGAGKMGGAMLQGWLALGLDPNKIAIIEPKPSSEVAALQTRGVRINPASVSDASVIVIAIKPQDAATVVPILKPLAGAGTLAISIMAGKTLGFLEDALPCAIVRAMPNTPAAIGRGITVAVPNGKVAAEHRAPAGKLIG